MSSRLLFFLLCITISTKQYAQEITKKDSITTINLESVTVQAARIDIAKRVLPYATAIIKTSNIDAIKNQLSIQEYLNEIPGIYVQNSSNFAQDARISIRGIGSRSAFGIRGIKLIVDGIPETTPDGQGQLDNINLDIIETIELVKSGVSALYGNASGGIININTKKDFTEPFINFKTTFGTNSRQQYNATAGVGSKNSKAVFHLGYQSFDGYRDNSGFKQWNFNGNFAHKFNDNLKLNVLVNYSDSPLAADAGGLTREQFENNPRQARQANIDFNSGEAISQYKIGTSLLWNINKKNAINTYAFTSGRSFFGRLPFSFGGIVDLNRNYGGHGSSVDFKLAKNDLKIGYDLSFQEDNRKRFVNEQGIQGANTLNQNEKFNTIGVYALDYVQLSNWSIYGGFRFDHQLLKVEDSFLDNGNDSSSITLNSINPTIGLTYKLSTLLNVFGNFSTAFETPTLSELSANPSGEQGFNPNLKPQKSRTIEFGIRGTTKRFSYQLTFYNLDTKNDLVPFELESFPDRTFFNNAGSTSRNGIETSLSYQLTPKWKLNTSYTYSSFKFDEYIANDTDLSGNILPGTPEHFGSVAVAYNTSKSFFTKLQLNAVDAIWVNDTNTEKAPGYLTANVQLGYEKKWKQVEILPFLGITNLFDKNFVDNVRINAFGSRFYESAPGVQVYGGLQFRF